MNTGVTGQGAQPQIIFIQQPAPRNVPAIRYDNYNTGVAKGLGITRIVTGLLCILIQIAAIVIVANNWKMGGWHNYLGTGIWAGSFVS